MLKALMLTAVVLTADWQTAPIDELKAEIERAGTHYDLDAALDLIPALQYRMNVENGETQTEFRWMLAETAVMAATMLRYEYEKPDKSNPEKRRLGREIDDVAAIGFNALGGLPDESEKHRMTADLLTMKMRTKFKGNKHHDEMEEQINKALVRDPENPKALLAQSRRKLFADVEHGGDFPAGLKIINKAIELDPTDESAYILRGAAFEREEMKAEAIADFERALEINPHATPAQEALERVRSESE